MMFDAYLMVDWSAHDCPKRGKDSIWYCHLRRSARGLRRVTLANPPTRAEALAALRHILGASSDRILAGFDFPNGYPRGFARRAGFSGIPWRAAWDGIAALIQDAPSNASNRFEVAAELNRRISGTTFPFWGCPTIRANRWLSPRKTHRYDDSLPERRICDTYLPTAQPCWKLAYPGSVGSQALLGIPIQRALRDDPALCVAARVWPYETGLRAPPADARVVLAEVYPSIVRTATKPGAVKDAVQVETIARRFAERDAAGLLGVDMAGPAALTPAQRAHIVAEEGWILGAGTLA